MLPFESPMVPNTILDLVNDIVAEISLGTIGVLQHIPLKEDFVLEV